MTQPYSFFALRKKKFFRSPQWETKIAVRILIGFFALYMLSSFLLLGLGLHFILKESIPNQPPFEVVNDFLLYYFSIELVARIFFQKLPVTEIQGFLLLPLPKSKIIRSVMGRLLFSWYNTVPILIFLPFSLIQITKGASQAQLLFWWFSILLLSLSLNYVVLFINKSKNAIWMGLGLMGIYVLNRFEVYDVPAVFAQLFNTGSAQWISLLGVGVLFSGMTVLSYHFFKRELYLDRGLQGKLEKQMGQELSFIDRLEWGGAMLKNDIRLIFRNARSRQVLLFSVLFLFYGLIFFPQGIYQDSVMLVFAGLFTTGGFMLSFGQYVPAWDSEYYPLLMCQNITYRAYLESKWKLMAFSVVLATILCLPYMYFGLKIYGLIVAGGLFNLGLGVYISLFSGALNRAPLKLNVKAKAFENTQAFNLTQFLFVLPKIVFPILIYWTGTLIAGFNGGVGLLAFSGLLGLCFHRQIMNAIEGVYQKSKHTTIEAFLNK